MEQVVSALRCLRRYRRSFLQLLDGLFRLSLPLCLSLSVLHCGAFHIPHSRRNSRCQSVEERKRGGVTRTCSSFDYSFFTVDSLSSHTQQGSKISQQLSLIVTSWESKQAASELLLFRGFLSFGEILALGFWSGRRGRSVLLSSISSWVLRFLLNPTRRFSWSSLRTVIDQWE